MNSPQIIAVTGLPSSGKGTFSEEAERYGFQKFVMGDVIRRECATRGLEVNRENSDYIMIKLREERGEEAIAVITLEWVLDAIEDGVSKILIDGIRSRKEIEFFNDSLSHLLLVGIHASQQTRLERALNRGRIDDAFDPRAFYERDEIELALGVGDVIATSDILIVAEETLDDTIHLYQEVISSILSNFEEKLIANN